MSEGARAVAYAALAAVVKLSENKVFARACLEEEGAAQSLIKLFGSHVAHVKDVSGPLRRTACSIPSCSAAHGRLCQLCRRRKKTSRIQQGQ